MHTTRRGLLCAAAAALLVLSGWTAAFAQTEDIEPRIIAERGTTLLGLSGSLSRFFSSEELMAGTYTVQVDGHHFLLNTIAIRFGVIGSDVFGGDPDDETASTAAEGLEAVGGAVYYFTPQSLWSFYSGAEYRTRITNRADGEAGTAAGIVGLQGALSSRASFFVEGGYGVRLRRGDEGELQTRITGLAGVRFRF